MRYLFALVLPPLAILFCGRPFLALFSLFLLPFYFPSALLALLIVASYHAERRDEYLIKAMQKTARHGSRMVDEMQRQQRRWEKEDAKELAAREKTEKDRARLASDGPMVFVPTPKKLLSQSIKEGLTNIGPVLSQTKAATIEAYHSLPEWAQPIVWGLSAGSLLSVVTILILIFRR